jgi:hypothetical protein
MSGDLHMSNNKQAKQDRRFALEQRLVGYLQDKLLNNQWAEYNRLHSAIMICNPAAPQYDVMADRQRELEIAIGETLKAKASAINRAQTMSGLIDRRAGD